MSILIQEGFEDTKGAIRIRKSKKNKQHKWSEEKEQTAIYETYTQNLRSNNKNPT